MDEQKKSYNPTPAQIFASVVYIGVVMAVTTLFISFVLSAFPHNAYLSRVVMTIAGLLMGASSIAFPVALHTWTFEKIHRRVTIAFYYGEVAIMAVNAVTSFMNLLSRNGKTAIPEWALLYEPFSVGTIVFTLLAWGTIFLFDPEHKRIQKDREDEVRRLSKEREAQDRFDNALAEKELEFVNSIEGEQQVALVVSERIRAKYDVGKYSTEKKHFGVSSGYVPAPASFVKKEATSPLGELDDGKS